MSLDRSIIGLARSLVHASLLATLAACGSGESNTNPTTSSPTANPDPAQDNTVPQINGSPATNAVAGQTYSFTPTATDADGDHLTFSISSKPSWVDFNTATGSLSGTPSTSDAGSHEEIVISVSDGQATSSLAQFAINVEQPLGSVTLAWQAPTENTDGSPITDLSGYKIHYGVQSGNYSETVTIGDAGVTQHAIENLAPGTYYFAVSAVAAGVESDLSGEASKTI